MENLPHIGQIIDFYPTPSERNAALIVEVFESDEISRPDVAILQFQPNGDIIAHERIHAVDPEDEENLEGRWAFSHEFTLQQSESHEEQTELGTQSNRFVGQLEAI